ncbi:hypothetical protein Q766_19460 [Flavobacterium subsaxonicum WB 4.1-42 = DSM 21790]|uniref:Uncharacterized protein n=1 Tax=Flavobacterium subsaxonicum WB 4.1-42 = DSM 21790 TaxID=1121898 RepID=A0A0A2MI69_9FLAO|nr:hypothetical protein Q766_19460 [Flavobacterium subsaxonicum WB 4.1-42 = DSM 21790]
MYLLNSYLSFLKKPIFFECKDSFLLPNYANFNIAFFAIKNRILLNTPTNCSYRVFAFEKLYVKLYFLRGLFKHFTYYKLL